MQFHEMNGKEFIGAVALFRGPAMLLVVDQKNGFAS